MKCQSGQKSVIELLEITPVTDAARIREQLNRLLAHPLFANSKRYPALLAYTVEQTLLGHAGELKERSIGVEVFGKVPAYDTNADPVVRITAGRSAQAPDPVLLRADPPRRTDDRAAHRVLCPPVPRAGAAAGIQLCSGLPRKARPQQGRPHPSGSEPAVAPALGPGRRGGIRGDSGSRCRPNGRMAAPYRSAPAAALEHGSASGRRLPTALIPTTFCLGEPAKNIDVGSINSFDTPVTESKPEPLYFRLHYSGNLALADVITLTRTVAALASRHKAFRVVPASDASFAQLREGPVVLIGAFDNIWTLRVTQKLRFGFESKDGVALAGGSQQPQQDHVGNGVGSSL